MKTLCLVAEEARPPALRSEENKRVLEGRFLLFCFSAFLFASQPRCLGTRKEKKSHPRLNDWSFFIKYSTSGASLYGVHMPGFLPK